MPDRFKKRIPASRLRELMRTAAPEELLKPPPPPEPGMFEEYGPAAARGLGAIFGITPITGAVSMTAGEALAQAIEGKGFRPTELAGAAGMGATGGGIARAIFSGPMRQAMARALPWAAAQPSVQPVINSLAEGEDVEFASAGDTIKSAAVGTAVAGGVAGLLGKLMRGKTPDAPNPSVPPQRDWIVEPTAVADGTVLTGKTGKQATTPVGAVAPIRGAAHTPPYAPPANQPNNYPTPIGMGGSVEPRHAVARAVAKETSDKERLLDRLFVGAMERGDARVADEFTQQGQRLADELSAAKIAQGRVGKVPEETVSESISAPIPGGKETLRTRWVEPAEDVLEDLPSGGGQIVRQSGPSGGGAIAGKTRTAIPPEGTPQRRLWDLLRKNNLVANPKNVLDGILKGTPEEIARRISTITSKYGDDLGEAGLAGRLPDTPPPTSPPTPAGAAAIVDDIAPIVDEVVPPPTSTIPPATPVRRVGKSAEDRFQGKIAKLLGMVDETPTAPPTGGVVDDIISPPPTPPVAPELPVIAPTPTPPLTSSPLSFFKTRAGAAGKAYGTVQRARKAGEDIPEEGYQALRNALMRENEAKRAVQIASETPTVAPTLPKSPKSPIAPKPMSAVDDVVPTAHPNAPLGDDPIVAAQAAGRPFGDDANAEQAAILQKFIDDMKQMGDEVGGLADEVPTAIPPTTATTDTIGQLDDVLGAAGKAGADAGPIGTIDDVSALGKILKGKKGKKGSDAPPADPLPTPTPTQPKQPSLDGLEDPLADLSALTKSEQELVRKYLAKKGPITNTSRKFGIRELLDHAKTHDDFVNGRVTFTGQPITSPKDKKLGTKGRPKLGDLLGGEGGAATKKPKGKKGGGGTSIGAGLGGAQDAFDIAKRNPEFATRLGLGSIGALTGASMSEDPLMGGLAGGAIGASLPSLVKAISTKTQALKQMGIHKEIQTLEDFDHAFKTGVALIPQFLRANLLTSPNIAFNSMSAPWGAGQLVGLEYKLAGDPRAAGFLRDMNPVNWQRIFWTESFPEAAALIGKSERAAGDLYDEAPTRLQKWLAMPGTIVTMGDVTTRKLAVRHGFTDDEARRMTLTGEPEWFRNLTNFQKENPVAQTLLPFARTLVNVANEGAMRFPGLGSYLQQFRKTPDSIARQRAQQAITTGVMGAGAATGYASSDIVDSGAENLNANPVRLERMLASLVSNLGGPYSLAAGVGYAGGKAAGAGDGWRTSIRKAATQGSSELPLPTTDIPMSFLNALFAEPGSERRFPSGLVPGIPRAIYEDYFKPQRATNVPTRRRRRERPER